MSPTRFAVIGHGNIGRRHAHHISNTEGAVLTAICDIDASKGTGINKGVRFFASVEELLSTGLADVACICTPNYLHEEHTVLALKAGLHALVEKPMAISTASCDRMIATAEETGKLIFAVKQNRYNPPVQAVRKLIEDGGLGKLYLVQVTCFWNRGDAYYAESPWRGKKAMDGGCLFTQFSHFVDILYYLAGPINYAKGVIHNYAHQHNTEVEDTGAFTLRTVSGATVAFSFTTCSYEQNLEGAITLFGEKGTVKIGGQYLNTIEYQHLQHGVLPEINIAARANDYGSYKGSMSNHDQVIKNVVDVLHHGHAIMVGAEEGREVVSMIEKMYAGAELL
jgi:UDP-N-acetyl-2-amino-2-deoxyglucuronate dehydrogenase